MSLPGDFDPRFRSAIRRMQEGAPPLIVGRDIGPKTAEALTLASQKPPPAARNLDREPGFLFTTLMILPAMVLVEIILLLADRIGRRCRP